jgi:hypothetical protein
MRLRFEHVGKFVAKQFEPKWQKFSGNDIACGTLIRAHASQQWRRSCRISTAHCISMSLLQLEACLLTELSPSWEAANCAATQELPSILRNPKVHHRVHKNPPLALPWARSIQSIPSNLISLRSISILSTHIRLGLPSGLFPYGFSTNILMHPFSPLFVLHAMGGLQNMIQLLKNIITNELSFFV